MDTCEGQNDYIILIGDTFENWIFVLVKNPTVLSLRIQSVLLHMNDPMIPPPHPHPTNAPFCLAIRLLICLFIYMSDFLGTLLEEDS